MLVETLILLQAAAAVTAVAPQDSSKAEITLEQAIQIALSENTSVKIADKEIERVGYAKKGTYAALYPTIDAQGSYQRTIKKQKMYVDGIPGMEDGREMGRWNAWNAGVSAAMPVVNAQLWKSLKISKEEVELAVEKARNSRLQTVTQVKNAYFAVLLAKESFQVFKSVYENALANCETTQKKYNAQKASDLDLTRAKTTLANAIPNVFDSENAISLALFQLKAVMGLDLDANIDTKGRIDDYSNELVDFAGSTELTGNSTLRQLEIQAAELADQVKLQQAAYIPSLSLAFSYSFIASENDFNFSNYKWSPYSYIGLSLNIPIFAGGKRRSQVRQARVQATELELNRINTERQLRIQISSYLRTMQTAVKTNIAAEDALESARKAYGIAKKSYEVGRSTLTDLNDSMLALTQAELSVCQSIYQYLTSRSSLEELLGHDFSAE